MIWHIQSGCANTTLCSLLSIDEKRFIINIKKAYEIYQKRYVAIRKWKYWRSFNARLYSYAGKYSTEIQYIQFYGILKGKSALMIFDKHANLKYKYGNCHFCAEGYYVSTVGLNEATVREYIQEQEKYDIAIDKLKEYEVPL